MMSIQALACMIILFLGLILGSVHPGFAANVDDEKMIVARENNAFALDLYAQLAAQETTNFAFSPYSLFSALSMTYA